jgi:hypothetical protein
MHAADAFASDAPQSDGMTLHPARALAFGLAALTDAVRLQLLNHSIETGIVSFKRCFRVPTDEPYGSAGFRRKKAHPAWQFSQQATSESGLSLAGWKVKMAN